MLLYFRAVSVMKAPEPPGSAFCDCRHGRSKSAQWGVRGVVMIVTNVWHPVIQWSKSEALKVWRDFGEDVAETQHSMWRGLTRTWERGGISPTVNINMTNPTTCSLLILLFPKILFSFGTIYKKTQTLWFFQTKSNH